MPTSQSKILELELLYKISSILNQTLDFESVAHPILEVVESTMGVEHATLTLYNRHTGEISIEIAEGLSSRQARKGRYKVGEGITGRVVETGKPIIIPSVAKDPDFLDRTGRGKTEDKAFLCVPVIMEHQVIGAFSADVQNPVEDELPEKLRLLEIIAQMLAAAVKLRREAREENELLKAENERLTLELKDRFQPDLTRCLKAPYPRLSWVKWVRARGSLQKLSTTAPNATWARSSAFIAPRCQNRCWIASCSAVCAERLSVCLLRRRDA